MTKLLPTRITAILRDTDTTNDSWPEHTTRLLLQLVTDELVAHLDEHVREQVDLVQRRAQAGLTAQGREHANRSRTYQHAKDVVRDTLTVPPDPIPITTDYELGVQAAIDHLHHLAPHVPPAAACARTLTDWARRKGYGSPDGI